MVVNIVNVKERFECSLNEIESNINDMLDVFKHSPKFLVIFLCYSFEEDLFGIKETGK